MNHDWHPIPMLIGVAMNGHSPNSCGRYATKVLDDDTIVLGREVTTVSEEPWVTEHVDQVFVIEDVLGDVYVVYREMARIEPPGGGWELSEVDDFEYR